MCKAGIKRYCNSQGDRTDSGGGVSVGAEFQPWTAWRPGGAARLRRWWQQVIHGLVVDLEHAELDEQAVMKPVLGRGIEEKVHCSRNHTRGVRRAVERVCLTGASLQRKVRLVL